jgi:threonine/homoserine/homoserine lactone efflux protein
MILFLKGVFLGLALAAPVGPINLLCMKRSLEQGRRAGFVTGLGAATADTFYGSIAAFGLTFISDWLEHYKTYLSVMGGVFFFILGLSLIRSKSLPQASRPANDSSIQSTYFSTVLLTLSNPTTVFSFLAAFAAIKLNTHEGDQVQPIYAVFATMGVFVGSMTWWTFLSWISSKFRASLNAKAIRRINIGAGLLLLIFAVIIFSRGAEGLLSPSPSSWGSSTH